MRNIKLDIPLDLHRSAKLLLDATLCKYDGAFWLVVSNKRGMTALRQELEGETPGQALDEAYALLAAWRDWANERTLEILGVQS
jgi:hypothetical protein